MTVQEAAPLWDDPRNEHGVGHDRIFRMDSTISRGPSRVSTNWLASHWRGFAIARRMRTVTSLKERATFSNFSSQTVRSFASIRIEGSGLSTCVQTVKRTSWEKSLTTAGLAEAW
jgi:hypothetical protein